MRVRVLEVVIMGPADLNAVGADAWMLLAAIAARAKTATAKRKVWESHIARLNGSYSQIGNLKRELGRRRTSETSG